MTTKAYLAAKAKFTKTGRTPEEFDLLALADATGASGFEFKDSLRLGSTREEYRDTIQSMKDRGILDQMGGRILLTMEGEKRVKQFFPQSKSDEYFEIAMATISRLVESEKGEDFRNANSFLVKVQSETGKKYE